MGDKKKKKTMFQEIVGTVEESIRIQKEMWAELKEKRAAERARKARIAARTNPGPRTGTGAGSITARRGTNVVGQVSTGGTNTVGKAGTKGT
jgi:hypothetical protein